MENVLNTLGGEVKWSLSSCSTNWLGWPNSPDEFSVLTELKSVIFARDPPPVIPIKCGSTRAIYDAEYPYCPDCATATYDGLTADDGLRRDSLDKVAAKVSPSDAVVCSGSIVFLCQLLFYLASSHIRGPV